MPDKLTAHLNRIWQAADTWKGTEGRGRARGHAVQVNRWRRFGHDRLYVHAPDGTRVGWVDLRSGERTVEVEQLRDAFERAVAAYADETEAQVPGVGSASPDARTQESGEPTYEDPVESTNADLLRAEPEPVDPSAPVGHEPEPWAISVDHTDLALRQAGEAAREQAAAYREAAPVKTLLARVLGVHNDERAWRIGAKGEEQVAGRLERLPETWRVLHAVPVGARGADIDHVAIGPGGVFTINAKHHPDARVWVAGSA